MLMMPFIYKTTKMIAMITTVTGTTIAMMRTDWSDLLFESELVLASWDGDIVGDACNI